MAKRPVTVLIGGRKYSRNPKGEIVDDTGAVQTGAYADIIAKELDSKIEEQAKPYADVSAPDKKTLDDAIKKVQQTSQTYKVTFKETGESFKTTEKLLPKVLERARGRGGILDTSVSTKQFNEFSTKLFGYINKEIDREKQRYERMERQRDVQREIIEETKTKPGEPEQEKTESAFSKVKTKLGSNTKKSFFGYAPLIMGSILVAALAFKDDIGKLYDNIANTIKTSIDEMSDVLKIAGIAGGAAAGVGAAAVGGRSLVKGKDKNLTTPEVTKSTKIVSSTDKNGKPFYHEEGDKTVRKSKADFEAQEKSAGKPEKGKADLGSKEKPSKDVIKKSLSKRLGKLVGKSVPLIGFILSGYEAVERSLSGDVVGASISAGGAAATFIPAVGTGIAATAAVANIVRDVYKDLYGKYPESDKIEEAKEKMKELYDMALEELKAPKPKDENTVSNLLEEYTNLIKENAPQMQRKPVGDKLRAALKSSGSSDEEIKGVLYSAFENAGVPVQESKPQSDGFWSKITSFFGGDKSKDQQTEKQSDQMVSVSDIEQAREAVQTTADVTIAAKSPTPEGATTAQALAGGDSSVISQQQNIANAPIVLPPKMIEGPPIVMPKQETLPSDIHTRNRDETLSLAQRNLNFSNELSEVGGRY